MMLTTQRAKTILLLMGMGVSIPLSLLLGFVIPPRAQMATWFHATGYYFIFGTFVLWLLSLLPKRLTLENGLHVFKRHAGALALAAGLVGAMCFATPPRFRILADETNLAGIAASMYRDKAFYNSIQGYVYYEKYHDLQHVWDIRSLFYPFLVSLMHTLTGYRAENGFIVNAIAGVGCLWMFYGLLQRWFSRWLSMVGMLLLAAFPLFVLWVTSGGFEIVNLLFTLIAFQLLDTLLVTGKASVMERLGLTLVLLSQLRYESVAITIGVGLAAISALRYIEISKLTYRSVLLPLLFLPVAWQRLVNLNNSDLQLPPGQAMFSWGTLKANLINVWPFFTTQPESYNTIPILFYLALMGMICGLWQVLWHKELRTRRLLTLGGSACLCVLLLLVTILSFNNQLGGFIHPATVRYGIIFLPLIVYGVILLLDLLNRINADIKRYVCVSAFVCLVWYWPIAANNESLRHLTLYREYKVTLDFLEQHYPHSEVIIIAERPGLYTPHLWGAVNFAYANANRDELVKKLEQHLIQDMIVIQKIQYSNHRPIDSTQLYGFSLIPLYESQTNSAWYIRFSKVLSTQSE